MDNTLLIRTLADEQELLRAATLTLDAEAQALRDGDMVELERITQTKQKQLAANSQQQLLFTIPVANTQIRDVQITPLY